MKTSLVVRDASFASICFPSPIRVRFAPPASPLLRKL